MNDFPQTDTTMQTPDPAPFDYHKAFSRNLGWLTEAEQHILRGKKVAIAGAGGVGGSHLLTLARLGIGKFNLSDFDNFEVENFNRQAGAKMSTIGRSKLETVRNMALDINPELDITEFPNGIFEDDVDEFLDGVDIYIDSLDFFAVKPRRAIFKRCAEKGIPAVTAAPLGMGTAILCFMPGKMTFEEYFRLEGVPETEQFLRFLVGLAPGRLHGSYLVEPDRINLEERRGPSTVIGCELAAGVAGTQAVKILLNRGDVINAPRGLHFDAYTNKLKKTWRPGGNNNPLQRLAIFLGKRMILGKQPRPLKQLDTRKA